MSENPRGRVPTSRLLPAAVGLGVLAVAHPLLDLLSRQPQFLIAHGLSPPEVALLALAIVVVPAVLFALAALITPSGWVAGVLLVLPVFLMLLHVGTRLGWPGVPLVLVALVGAVGAAVVYLRHPRIREHSRYLMGIPAVVLIYFFGILPGTVMADQAEVDGESTNPVANPVPVVVLVFDELPVASLVDGEGRLIEEQYPSFARLAADGVWYRNAITVETQTTESIPAILSGLEVDDGLVPTASQHPMNLFAALAGSHDVDGVEPVTSLCPDELCTAASADGGIVRVWARVASDLAVVYGHLVVPAPWAERLPAIDQNWTGFVDEREGDDASPWDLEEAVGEAVSDRRADVARFVASLETTSDRPPLRISHMVLPHRPWEFLPDGTRHGQDPIDGYGRRGWGSDEYFVAEGWRRHLLQVGYVDTVVGSVIARLEETGLYRSSLLIVVADHGVHFAPDTEDMRVTNRGSLGSILPVPLFVKYPEGFSPAPVPGTIVDRRAETIDVVPTVYEVIGLDPRHEMDGRSLLGNEERGGSVLELRGEPFPVGSGDEEMLAVAREKERWFPGGDPWALVPTAEVRGLLGRELPSRDDPDVELAMDSEEPGPPAFQGTLLAGELSDQGLVGLTSDGILISAGKPFEGEDGRTRFSFLVDPDAGHGGPFQAWLLVEGTLIE